MDYIVSKQNEIDTLEKWMTTQLMPYISSVFGEIQSTAWQPEMGVVLF